MNFNDVSVAMKYHLMRSQCASSECAVPGGGGQIVSP